MGQWHTPRHLTKVEQLLNAVVIFSFFEVVSWTMLQNAHDRSNILKPAHVYPLARLQPRPPALTVTFVLRRIRSQLHTLERAFFPHLNVQNYSTDSPESRNFFLKKTKGFRSQISNVLCHLLLTTAHGLAFLSSVWSPMRVPKKTLYTNYVAFFIEGP